MIKRIIFAGLIVATSLCAKGYDAYDLNVTMGDFYDRLVLLNKEDPMWYNYLEAPKSRQDRKKTLCSPEEMRNAMGAYQIVICDDRYLMVFKEGKLMHSLILRDNFGNIEFKEALDYALKIDFDTMRITLKHARLDTEWIGGYVYGPAYDVYGYELLRFEIDRFGRLSYLGTDSFKEEDALLNRRYKELLDAAPGWARREIVKEQRLWLRYKIAHCSGDHIDTFYADSKLCEYELTKERNRILKEEIEDWEGFPPDKKFKDYSPL